MVIDNLDVWHQNYGMHYHPTFKKPKQYKLSRNYSRHITSNPNPELKFIYLFISTNPCTFIVFCEALLNRLRHEKSAIEMRYNNNNNNNNN
jgi:hypothetical protein